MLLQSFAFALCCILVQWCLYKSKAPKLLLYLLPVCSLIFMIYVIFTTVREQALISTSIPLWIKVFINLSFLLISLIAMITCIVLRFKKQAQRESIQKIILTRFSAFLGILFIILLFTVYLAQEYVIFFPNHSIQDHYRLSQDSQYERLQIGETYGWCKYNPNSDEIIVYFGGNAQNTTDTFLEFKENGIFDILVNESFLSIDYPSYGESKGSLSQASLFNMADEVMQYVQSHYPDKKINLIGYSIGTGIASYAASHYDLHTFTLIAPYNNGKDLFNTYFPIFYGPFSYLIRYPLPSDQYVKNVTCDTLLLYSEVDSIIPARLTKKLIKAFPKEPTLIIDKNKTHAQLVGDNDSWQHIVDFIHNK